MKHHHRPTYSGDLTGAILSNESTVTGRAIIKVLNGPRDSHFHVENPSRVAVYPGDYGTLTIDHDGNWTYELDDEKPAVANLETGETLTDSIVVRPQYRFRNQDGPAIVVTITGA